MSEAIVVALIGAGQAVTLGLIGILAARIGKVRKDASAVRDQVVNDHIRPDGTPINMRDENDRRHDETRRWFNGVTRDIGGIREDIRGLRSDIRHERDRIDELEDTITTKRKANP